MSKSSKYILAAGCSFTDKDFVSVQHPELDTSWPKWPEILGEYLSLKVKNIGESGVGNDYITSKVIQNILKDRDNIELVVIGWSEVQRFSLLDIYRFNPMTSLHRPEYYEHEIARQKSAIPLYKYLFGEFLINKTFHDKTNLFQEQITYWFKQMWQIQELCKAFGIKFIMSPLCGGFDLSKYQQVENSFDGRIEWTEVEWHIAYGRIEELYDLDREHYIGYPFMKSFYGFHLQREITDDHSRRISDKDSHPNESGHEEIARYYYEQYTKVYS